MIWFVLAYLIVAAFFAVVTWIDNAGTHYVNGPPSGFLTGLFWPLALIVVLLSWWFDPFRRSPVKKGK